MFHVTLSFSNRHFILALQLCLSLNPSLQCFTRVTLDVFPAVVRNQIALVVCDHESGDAVYTVFLFQRRHACFLFAWKSEPGHLSEIAFECFVISIQTNKNHFKYFLVAFRNVLVGIYVKISQSCGEQTARGCPMCAEVVAPELGLEVGDWLGWVTVGYVARLYDFHLLNLI